MIVWDGYHSTCIVFDGSSNNFDALYIQVIGRFVQYENIRLASGKIYPIRKPEINIGSE